MAAPPLNGRLWGRKTDVTFFGTPYLDPSNSKWSLQHTEAGNYNDRQKYGHQGHPLQKEDQLRSMEDFGQRSGEYARTKVAASAQAAAIGGQAPKAHALALELYKGELANERAKHNAMFVHDFTEWLRGSGKPQEYYKAGYYSYLKRDSNRNFLAADGSIIGAGDGLTKAQQDRLVKSGNQEGKPISFAPDVLAYLAKKQDRIIDYEAQRAKMRNRQGRGSGGGDMTMDNAWKYYKHWVKGLNDVDELEDYISELPSEYNARTKQNDKALLAINQQQAAANVEQAHQQQIAGLSKGFEDHAKAVAAAQQQTNLLLQQIATTPQGAPQVADNSQLLAAYQSLQQQAQAEKTSLQTQAANQAITITQLATQRDAITQAKDAAQKELERMRTEGNGVVTTLGAQIATLQQQLAEGENLSRTERQTLNKQMSQLHIAQLAALNDARDQAGQIKLLHGNLTGVQGQLDTANVQARQLAQQLGTALQGLSQEQTTISGLKMQLDQATQTIQERTEGARTWADAAQRLAGEKEAAENLAEERRKAGLQLIGQVQERTEGARAWADAAQRLAAEKELVEKQGHEAVATWQAENQRLTAEKLAAEQEAQMRGEGAQEWSNKTNQLLAEKMAAEKKVQETNQALAFLRQTNRPPSQRTFNQLVDQQKPPTLPTVQPPPANIVPNQISAVQERGLAGTVLLDPQSGPANEYDERNDPSRMLAADFPYLSSTPIDEMSPVERKTHHTQAQVAYNQLRGYRYPHQTFDKLQNDLNGFLANPQKGPVLARYVNRFSNEATGAGAPLVDVSSNPPRVRNLTGQERQALKGIVASLPEDYGFYPLTKGPGDYRPA